MAAFPRPFARLNDPFLICVMFFFHPSFLPSFLCVFFLKLISWRNASRLVGSSPALLVCFVCCCVCFVLFFASFCGADANRFACLRRLAERAYTAWGELALYLVNLIPRRRIKPATADSPHLPPSFPSVRQAGHPAARESSSQSKPSVSDSKVDLDLHQDAHPLTEVP